MKRLKKLDKSVSESVSSHTASSLEIIVLELIENALDAGSDSIVVRLNLDKNTVIVSDNGIGMTPQQLDSLGPGCTSKIRNLNDVEQCKTYGFKGQLLANIAKVSHLSIVLHCDDSGYKVEFGEKSSSFNFEDELVNPKNCNFYYLQPNHTHVIVKDFFYNLPVRQFVVYSKFLLNLKKGLVYLKLKKLKVYIDQELKIDVEGKTHLINEVFGLTCRFKKVTTSMGQIKLTAYISNDTRQRYQFFLYNNRPIDLKILIRNICLIQFEGPVVINELFQDPRKMIWFSKYNEELIYILEKIFSNRLVSPKKTSPRKVLSPRKISPTKQVSPKRLFPSPSKNLQYEGIQKTMTRDDLQHIQVINQIHKEFILVRSKNQLLMIDQHAMDERIRVEQLFQAFFRDMQLLDVSIELKEDEIELLLRFKDHLHQFIQIQDNRITKLPVILEMVPKDKLIQGLIAYTDDIINCSKFKLSGNWFQDINNLPTIIIDSLNSKACRASVMFGDKLTKKEIMQMIADLSRCHLPFQCAHGRPSIIPLIDL